MHAQRVREGESRAGKQIIKWTAEGTVKSFRKILNQEFSVKFHDKPDQEFL